MNISNDDIKEARKVLAKFKNIKTAKEIFYNLCFCILVPQTKFSKVFEIVEKLKSRNFINTKIPQQELAALIKGSRYNNRKAKYLLELKEKIVFVLHNLVFKYTDVEKRVILEAMIKGMGMKATSHFLRNMGATDLAIIDTHILRFLNIKGKKFSYEKIEEKFRKIAKKHNLSVAELDAIIWKNYSKTEWKDFIY